LVHWLLIQVKTLYALLSEGIHEVAFLSVSRLDKFAETKILSLEVESIKDSPVFVLLEVCFTGVKEIATLVLSTEGKNESSFLNSYH
jgi:hypothetical protein